MLRTILVAKPARATQLPTMQASIYAPDTGSVTRVAVPSVTAVVSGDGIVVIE